MKNTSLLILLVIVFLVVYTAFTFIMWDWNPQLWGPGVRAVAIGIWAMLSIPVMILRSDV